MRCNIGERWLCLQGPVTALSLLGGSWIKLCCSANGLPHEPAPPGPLFVSTRVQLLQIKLAWQRYLKRIAIAAVGVRPWVQSLQGVAAMEAASPDTVPPFTQAARQHLQVWLDPRLPARLAV